MKSFGLSINHVCGVALICVCWVPVASAVEVDAVTSDTQPAQVVRFVSNLDSPPTTTIPIVSSVQWLAQSFTTGPEPSLLYGVTIAEEVDPIEAIFDLSVHADAEGMPGAVLPGGELTPIDLQPNPGRVNLLYESTGVQLEPNSRYWVMASVSRPVYTGISGWHQTPDSNMTSDYGWDILPGWSNSTNDGQSWGYLATRNPLYMEITGLLIPEPASLTLIGLGGLIARRRRKG